MTLTGWMEQRIFDYATFHGRVNGIRRLLDMQLIDGPKAVTALQKASDELQAALDKTSSEPLEASNGAA